MDVRRRKFETFQMAEWRTYLANPSREAALAMKDPDNREVAMRRFRPPTTAEKRETANRWAAINAVSEKELAEHCQFDGMGKLSR